MSGRNKYISGFHIAYIRKKEKKGFDEPQGADDVGCVYVTDSRALKDFCTLP